jgi:hypothetical protein
MKTISVIEIVDDEIESITSFFNNEKGVQQARELFISIARKHNFFKK